MLFTKLHTGCGMVKLKGFHNVDIDPPVRPHQVVDVMKMPFKDEQFGCRVALVFRGINKIVVPISRRCLGFYEFSLSHFFPASDIIFEFGDVPLDKVRAITQHGLQAYR